MHVGPLQDVVVVSCYGKERFSYRTEIAASHRKAALWTWSQMSCVGAHGQGRQTKCKARKNSEFCQQGNILTCFNALHVKDDQAPVAAIHVYRDDNSAGVGCVSASALGPGNDCGLDRVSCREAFPDLAAHGD